MRPTEVHAFSGVDRVLLLALQTRLRCRLSRRLRAADFERFLAMTADQVAHALSEATYGLEARRLGMSLTGGRLVRAMAHEEMAREVETLRRLSIASRPALAWLEAVRWRYDLIRLRAALRARRISTDLTDGTLTPLANLPFSLYQSLAARPQVDLQDPEFAPLRNSPFAATLARAFGEAPPAPDEIETALVHDLYCGLHGRLSAAAAGDRPACDLFVDEAHWANLQTLLAARAIGASAEQTAARVVPCSFWARLDAVRALHGAPDARRLVAELRHMPHAGILGDLELDGTAQVDGTAVETAARRAFLASCRRIIRSGRPTAGAIPAYLYCLECEARNLWSLVSGHEGGFSRNETASMLAA